MLLVAHVVLDYLNCKMRWRLYGTVASAWATFLLWAPSLRNQLSVTKDGTYTPRLDVGTFFEALEMQTPLGVVLLLIALLAVLRWLSADDPSTSVESQSPSPAHLSVLLVLALAWMSVAVITWAGSHVIQPFFMRRYVSPCVNAWVLVAAAILAVIYYAPPRRRGILLPRWCHQLGWVGTLGFCIVWQPLRAWTEPPKGPPFVDTDYGYSSLPIVFEDAMDFLPRFVYGAGREYVLLLDKHAAAADPAYYTKLTENMFSKWRPFFPRVRILYYDELPAWPNGYLAVDDELAKTFDWLFQNKAEIKAEMLGPWETGNRVYRVAPPAR